MTAGAARPRAAIFALAVGLSAFQLWQSTTGSLSATFARPIHIAWVMALTFLGRPLWSGRGPEPRWALAVDSALAAASLYAGWVIVGFDYAAIDHILYGLSPHDLAVGALFLCLLLEATRRTVGWVMVGVGLVFLLYNGFGHVLPDLMAHRGFGLERIVRLQIFTQAGLFGTPLGIAASTVFIFVLFGAFLEVTGAGRFFIDLAFAAAGRFRGGPAKASVLASAAMGSISGSAIANTVTTGSLTIPMMKKLGYRPEQAAGIEAAASTGGQIMPPIMGAGAFIMADFTSTPYRDIVALSVAPAMLYFACTLLFVHLMAAKLGLEGMRDPPPVRRTLREGMHFLLPLGLVAGLLLADYSPPLVGAAGCLAVVVTGAARRNTRIGWRTLLEGLKAGALMALPISLACATAGIAVGVIGQTGIGLQFTESVVELAAGQLWLALVLVAGIALVRDRRLHRDRGDGGARSPGAGPLPARGAHDHLLALPDVERDAPPRARRLRGGRRRGLEPHANGRRGGEALGGLFPHPGHDGLFRPHPHRPRARGPVRLGRGGDRGAGRRDRVRGGGARDPPVDALGAGPVPPGRGTSAVPGSHHPSLRTRAGRSRVPGPRAARNAGSVRRRRVKSAMRAAVLWHRGDGLPTFFRGRGGRERAGIPVSRRRGARCTR